MFSSNSKVAGMSHCMYFLEIKRAAKITDALFSK